MPAASHNLFADVPQTDRRLVNVMLEGGADFRFVFVPAPDYDPTYVEQFWSARAALYAAGDYADYASMYDSEYITVTDSESGFSFGIHKSCDWLAQQFTTGNVAIISNVVGSKNRRHDHSQLIVNAGDVTTGRIDTERDGWGGRLAETISGQSNVAALTEAVSLFCSGTNSAARLEHVFHAINLRDMSLPQVNQGEDIASNRNALIRSLAAYYHARGIEIESEKTAGWPYRQFFKHHSFLDTFGGDIEDALSLAPLPALLQNLNLNNDKFTQQCQNLYDSFFISDKVNSRVFSFDYRDWDHHAALEEKITLNLTDVFSLSGGLAAVMSEMASNIPTAFQGTVYLFGSDFGRQLAANGSSGTDHGTASYSIIIGPAVNGGIRGDMFPLAEALPDLSDGAGRTPFEIPGTDIVGETSLERVLAKVCDWVSPGSGELVCPNAASGPLEAGVDLNSLFG